MKMKIFERLKYWLFGFWFPISFDNYRDASHIKDGVPSHTIYWINLKTGKHKAKHYYNQDFMSEKRFYLIRKIHEAKMPKTKYLIERLNHIKQYELSELVSQNSTNQNQVTTLNMPKGATSERNLKH